MPGYDATFMSLQTAKAWGYKLHEWRAMNVCDRAELVSHESFVAICDSYREEYRREYHEKRPNLGLAKTSSQNEFTAMKREMGFNV